MGYLDGDADRDEHQQDIEPAVQQCGLGMFAKPDDAILKTGQKAWFWLLGIMMLTGPGGLRVPVAPCHVGILLTRRSRIMRLGVLVLGGRVGWKRTIGKRVSFRPRVNSVC